MTEERKKELMEETAKNIFEDAFKDLPYLQQRMNMLIDTVAAEAREEGIGEMQVSGWDAVIGEAEKIDMPSGGKLNDWSALMNRLCSVHQRAAERLKEKG